MSQICHVFYNSVLSQKLLHGRIMQGKGVLPDLMYLFSCTLPPFITVSWPTQTVHQYIMLCDWARTYSFVYDVTSVTVTVRYNIKICYRSYILSNTTRWMLIPLIHTFYSGDMFRLRHSHHQAYSNSRTSAGCCTFKYGALIVRVYR
jgi:hypothetical protein